MTRTDAMQKLRDGLPCITLEITLCSGECAVCHGSIPAYDTVFMVARSSAHNEAVSFPHCRACIDALQQRRIAWVRDTLTKVT